MAGGVCQAGAAQPGAYRFKGGANAKAARCASDVLAANAAAAYADLAPVIAVTDPCHPLYGRTLKLSGLTRLPGHVRHCQVEVLPGRIGFVPVCCTNLSTEPRPEPTILTPHRNRGPKQGRSRAGDQNGDTPQAYQRLRPEGTRSGSSRSLVGLGDIVLKDKSSPEVWVIIAGSIGMAVFVCAATGLLGRLGVRVRL
jgi:hypothetical protein